MNKEDILAMSRRENKNRDLAEKEIRAQACAIAGCVGALVCCAISVMAHMILGDYLLMGYLLQHYGDAECCAVCQVETAHRSGDCNSASYGLCG